MSELIVMTKKNYEDLKKELEYLVKVKRPEIIERIAEARSHGDLSENAEYDSVVVLDESYLFENGASWLYTAITRAKKNLVQKSKK